jgi:hypothetical protein
MLMGTTPFGCCRGPEILALRPRMAGRIRDVVAIARAPSYCLHQPPSMVGLASLMGPSTSNDIVHKSGSESREDTWHQESVRYILLKKSVSQDTKISKNPIKTSSPAPPSGHRLPRCEIDNFSKLSRLTSSEMPGDVFGGAFARAFCCLQIAWV